MISRKNISIYSYFNQHIELLTDWEITIKKQGIVYKLLPNENKQLPLIAFGSEIRVQADPCMKFIMW